MQDPHAHAVAGDDGRGACGCAIAPGTGVRNSQLLQALDGGHDVRRAVIHVVGNADGMNAGKPERLAADCPIGEKSFREGGAIRRRQVEAAFQIAEHHVRRAQVTGDFPKRHLRIGDIHEIDVARQNQRARHTPTSNLRALATYLSRRTYPAASIAAVGVVSIAFGLSIAARSRTMSCFARIAAVSAVLFCLQSSTALPDAQMVQPVSDFDMV